MEKHRKTVENSGTQLFCAWSTVSITVFSKQWLCAMTMCMDAWLRANAPDFVKASKRS